ncbi:MAG: LLM class flavin-dependent oxidoreductase [Chloroflexota bacterium]|nr:LLM class flavin-dependent oxidoreductase [Chloroflexota bacterium]
MADKRIGVAAMGGDSRTVVARIQHLEELGIEAAWLTSGGAGPDALTTFAAAAAVTDRILMGTSIIPTYPRHPIVAVAQTQVVAQLAPGRFRLGLGPSHKVSIEPMFGIEHNAPLTNLREYIQVVKQLLWEGQVDYDGTQYHGHGSLPGAPAPDVPVMASALRRRSFRLCGEVADGAISWVCPGQYLRDVALPEMQRGAESAGREVPPLVAHAPVCVHDNPDEVREAARSQLANYPRSPFYQEMFAASGHPEARESAWSDGMIEDVVLSGDEETVAGRLRELFDWGATEILAHPISAGGDSQASVERSLNLIATVGQGL